VSSGIVIVAAGLPADLAAGDDQQKAAPLGLFVLVLLGVACYFLFKSMSRHLKRVRDDFPAPGAPTLARRDRTVADRTAANRVDPLIGEPSPADRGPDSGRPIPPVAP
jgi:hypothetical protein